MKEENSICPACKKCKVFRKVTDRVLICNSCAATLRRNNKNKLVWIGEN